MALVNESPKVQTPQESLAYSLTTTPWCSSPTGVTLIVWDVTDENNPVDVTSSTTAGSNGTLGDAITTKRIQSLTLGKNYRVDILFSDASSNTYEAALKILCREP